MKNETKMKIQFTTDLLLFDENEKHIWLSDLMPNVLDESIEVDDLTQVGRWRSITISCHGWKIIIYYTDGELDGRVTIDGIMYSFDLEGMFDDEISIFDLVD